MKKHFKKVISIVLCAALLGGVGFWGIDMTGAASEAVEENYNSIQFTEQPLQSGVSTLFPNFADSSNYYCATDGEQIVVNGGYAYIFSFEVPEDGVYWIKNDDGNRRITFNNTNLSGREVEFCVTNQDGEILYPTDGKVAVINETTSTHTISDTKIPVSKGDTINHILYGVSGERNSVLARVLSQYLPDSSHDGEYKNIAYGRLCPKDEALNTCTSLYYATDYQKVTRGNEKRLVFDKKEMTLNSDGDKFTGGKAWTNHGQFVGNPNSANIFTVTMPKDGTFLLRNMTVTLWSGTQRRTRLLDFCITDGDGDILYPTNQEPLHLNENLGAQSGISLYIENMKAGDEINFVFFNIYAYSDNLSDTTQIGFNATGEIYCAGTHINRDASNHLWPVANLGVIPEKTDYGYNNMSYHYSENVEIVDKNASYDFDRYMQPYWEGKTVYNESVWVVENEGGTIADIPLLYEIDSVKAVYSADLTQKYEEGIDYTVVDGKLHILENSRIPVTPYEEYYPETGTEYKDVFPKWAPTGGSEGYLFFDESGLIHDKQIAVTYTHLDKWSGNNDYVPKTAVENLPKTFNKLRNKEALNMAFYGDSITTGANASSLLDRSPYMPTWMDLLEQGLKKAYGYENITSDNYAVGGTTVQWGAQNVDTYFADKTYDLVIVAFGMNNVNEASYVQEQTELIITGLKAINPDVEILLVSTTLYNTEAVGKTSNRTKHEAKFLELAEKYDGVGVSCMTSMHQSLNMRKAFKDMTGNNVNHPNDFLARAYAQTILKSLTRDVLPGDMNGDMQIDVRDIIRFKTETYISENADMLKDYEINIEDLNALRQYLVSPVEN